MKPVRVYKRSTGKVLAVVQCPGAGITGRVVPSIGLAAYASRALGVYVSCTYTKLSGAYYATRVLSVP